MKKIKTSSKKKYKANRPLEQNHTRHIRHANKTHGGPTLQWNKTTPCTYVMKTKPTVGQPSFGTKPHQGQAPTEEPYSVETLMLNPSE